MNEPCEAECCAHACGAPHPPPVAVPCHDTHRCQTNYILLRFDPSNLCVRAGGRSETISRFGGVLGALEPPTSDPCYCEAASIRFLRKYVGYSMHNACCSCFRLRCWGNLSSIKPSSSIKSSSSISTARLFLFKPSSLLVHHVFLFNLNCMPVNPCFALEHIEVHRVAHLDVF